MTIVIRQEDLVKEEIIDATPTTKEVFLAFIRGGYTLPDAVAEYVDNALEQAKLDADGKEHTVKIRTLTEGQDYILQIEDNCGGCPRKDAIRFVRLGLSGVDPNSGNISRFGIGGKAAGLAVSRIVEVLSRPKGEPGWKVELNRDEILNKEDWKFPVSQLNEKESIEEGSTRIKLHLRDKEDYNRFPIKGKEILEKRYGSAELSRHASLYINTEKLQPIDPFMEILNETESPTKCKPIVRELSVEVPVETSMGSIPTKVKFRAKIGLLTEGSRVNRFGANIFCNGRLLVSNNKLGLWDLTYEEDKIGHAGNQLIWVRAVVDVIGAAGAMPWNNKKSDLDETSPTYRKLEEFLKSSYQEFIDRMGDAKSKLKERIGSKKLPDIREVIVDHYLQELRKDRDYEKQVRNVVKVSRPFTEALRKLKTLDETVTAGGESGTTPRPPSHPETINLAAFVETDKVELAREKIEKEYGKSNVKNTDIVRIVLDHYLHCDK